MLSGWSWLVVILEWGGGTSSGRPWTHHFSISKNPCHLLAVLAVNGVTVVPFIIGSVAFWFIKSSSPCSAPVSKLQTYQYSHREEIWLLISTVTTSPRAHPHFTITACSVNMSNFEKLYRGAGSAYGSCFNSEIFTVYYSSQWKEQNWSAAPFIHSPNRPRFIKLAWPIAAGVMEERGAQRTHRPKGYKYRESEQLPWSFYTLIVSAGHQAHRISDTMKVSVIHEKFWFHSNLLMERFLTFSNLVSTGCIQTILQRKTVKFIFILDCVK